MLVSDLARAPLIASIPLLHALGWLSFPLLLVLVALVGVFLAPYFASQRLILPELVGDDERDVAQANARRSRAPSAPPRCSGRPPPAC